MSEYSGFQIGKFVAPLTSSTANPLLQDADPALWASLNFFQAMLVTYLGARFDAEVARVGLVGAAGGSLAGQVAATALPFDPVPQLQQAQFAPPFLALFPAEETYEEHTRNWPHLKADWTLLYVLPALSPAQFAQFYPFLRAVARTLFDRLEQGHDPSYQSDALFCELGGIEQIKIVRTAYGTIQGVQTNLFFPSLRMELEVAERKMGAPAAQTTFAGVDASVDVTDPDGSNAVVLAEFSENL